MEEVAERKREVIERGRAEAAPRESEADWCGLFERMAEGFFVGGAIRDQAGRMQDFRFAELNPAFERLTGLPITATLGRPVNEAIPGIPSELIERCAHVTLLVVDGNRDAADAVGALLKVFGAEVRVAYGGESAIPLVQSRCHGFSCWRSACR